MNGIDLEELRLRLSRYVSHGLSNVQLVGVLKNRHKIGIRYSKKLLWLDVGHSNNDPKYVAYNFTQNINCIKAYRKVVVKCSPAWPVILPQLLQRFRDDYGL